MEKERQIIRELLVQKLAEQGKQSKVVKALVFLHVHRITLPEFLATRTPRLTT